LTEGGKSRRGQRLAFLVVVMLASALAAAFIAAPAGADPANEEYELDIPDAGDGGSSGDPATDESSTTATETDDDTATVDATDGSTDDGEVGGAVGGGTDDGSANGGTGGSGDSKTSEGSGPQGAGSTERAHTIPEIAADGAGSSGIWLLLVGLALVLAVALYLIYKRRRPRQLEA
jgi:LPXTG-motif cell wall-anchored protein